MAKVLKYVRARMDLLNYIAKNGYAPGDRLPSEKTLVSQFNMSSIPLRRALEELAEQGVIEKIQGLGTFLRKPVTLAASQGKIVLLDIQAAKPYTIPTMARELQLLLEERRMDFQFIPVAKPGGHIDRLIADATGVLVVGRITPEWATYLEQVRQPLVILGSNPFADRFHTVAWDWQRASYLLTDHFIRKGCRDIGLINGDIDYFPAQRMYDGYRQALRKHGLPYDKRKVIWLPAGQFYERIDAFMKQTPVDAVVVEAGAIRHLFNWAWNHPPRPRNHPRNPSRSHPQFDMPTMGMIREYTTQYIVADDPQRIVQARFEEDLLPAAVDAFFSLLAGREERVHHILKPTIACG